MLLTKSLANFWVDRPTFSRPKIQLRLFKADRLTTSERRMFVYSLFSMDFRSSQKRDPKKNKRIKCSSSFHALTCDARFTITPKWMQFCECAIIHHTFRTSMCAKPPPLHICNLGSGVGLSRLTFFRDRSLTCPSRQSHFSTWSQWPSWRYCDIPVKLT